MLETRTARSVRSRQSLPFYTELSKVTLGEFELLDLVPSTPSFQFVTRAALDPCPRRPAPSFQFMNREV
ncbi:hypothetical protein HA466_0239220 [Hirschfeldia incana]|nr:hypothetical protein HA466_0239220 [Hirschfeldia incana]